MSATPISVATVAAPAKLNLCLRVVGGRADGYHELDSLVVPVGLYDDLCIAVQDAPAPSVELVCEPSDGLPPPEKNLAVRAARLFLRITERRARVAIHLRKRIPMAAGLGGGSTDAAAVLRALNVLSGRPVASALLRARALELGADVPFFVYGRPARMRGIGERLDPFDASSIRQPIVIAFPKVGVSTQDVYRTYDRSLTSEQPASTIRAPILGQEPLRELLVNDLETAAVQVQPAVEDLRHKLCALGAQGVLMTGSGAAVFGIWKHWDDARAAVQRLRAGGTWARGVEILHSSPTVEVTT